MGQRELGGSAVMSQGTASHSRTGSEEVTARFGGWTFDGPRRLLIDGGGQPVHLAKKVFDLLALLIANAPRVVPKTELHARLWPDTFVAEATLVALVKDLRRALQDHDPAASIIRTSHGVGYAFCLPLELVRPEAAVMDRWVIVRDRRVPLKAGDNLIGRDPRAEICLDAAGVSRRHAQIVVTASRSKIEDLGSKNGTLVGDVRVIEPMNLRNGDIIRVGPLTVIYRMDDAGMTTETVPIHVDPGLGDPPTSSSGG